MPIPTPPELLAFIKQTFDWEELKTLCFQLYVPFDDLAGDTREAKARELIGYMQRFGRMPDLVAALERERPEQFASIFDQRTASPARYAPPNRNPNQVFISHAHQDAAFAQRLAGDLRRQHYEVWMAPDSIPLGERWVDAINRALRQSGIFLLVSTPHAVSSTWVQDETSYAIELAAKGQIRFIRLDVEEADAPPLWTLRQHVSFRRGYREGLGTLLEALESGDSPHSATAERLQAPLSVSAAATALPAPSSDESNPAAALHASSRIGPLWRRLAEAPTKRWRGVQVWAWLAGLAALALLFLAIQPIRNLIERPATDMLGDGADIVGPLATLGALQTPTSPPQNEDEYLMPLPGGSQIELVRIPAGSFRMGSLEVGPDAQPIHPVSIDAFWLARHEITNAQYAAFTAYTGHVTTAEDVGGGYGFAGEEGGAFVEGVNWQHPRGPESSIEGLSLHPVVQVSWMDAAAYCEWMGGRLPTEAEWEYAARGPEELTFPWGNDFDGERLNYCDRSCQFAWSDQAVDDGFENKSPVGSFPDGVNWAEVHDLGGNVREWVNDWYGETTYVQSEQANPTGPNAGALRVLRGGSWASRAADTRSALRGNDFPDARYSDVGFRCALD